MYLNPKKTSLWRLKSPRTKNKEIAECLGLFTVTEDGKLFKRSPFDHVDTLVGIRLTPTMFVLICSLEPWNEESLHLIAQQVNQARINVKT